MKRWISTLIILAMITGGVIWEQIFVNTTFDELETQLTALTVAVEKCGDDTANTPENIEAINKLETFWLEREKALCYLVKHTETFQISDTIIYAKNFITFGNKEEAMLALKKLQYLFDVHHYNLGTSLENII